MYDDWTLHRECLEGTHIGDYRVTINILNSFKVCRPDIPENGV
jgi:hypothetical protein